MKNYFSFKKNIYVCVIDYNFIFNLRNRLSNQKLNSSKNYSGLLRNIKSQNKLNTCNN